MESQEHKIIYSFILKIAIYEEASPTHYSSKTVSSRIKTLMLNQEKSLTHRLNEKIKVCAENCAVHHLLHNYLMEICSLPDYQIIPTLRGIEQAFLLKLSPQFDEEDEPEREFGLIDDLTKQVQKIILPALKEIADELIDDSDHLKMVLRLDHYNLVTKRSNLAPDYRLKIEYLCSDRVYQFVDLQQNPPNYQAESVTKTMAIALNAQRPIPQQIQNYFDETPFQAPFEHYHVKMGRTLDCHYRGVEGFIEQFADLTIFNGPSTGGNHIDQAPDFHPELIDMILERARSAIKKEFEQAKVAIPPFVVTLETDFKTEYPTRN